MEGYIKLFRSIENWEWYDDANTMRVFLDILLHTQYKPTRYKGYEIGAGECVIGRKLIAKRLNISEQSVRTAINHLISTNEITTESTNRFTIVRIENWEKWQVCKGEDNQQNNQQSNIQSTNNQPTTNQQLTTYKKERKKEYKNIRNSCSYTDVWQSLTEEQIADIESIYVDGSDLICEVAYEVKKKRRLVDDPYRYIIGWAENNDWMTKKKARLLDGTV